MTALRVLFAGEDKVARAAAADRARREGFAVVEASDGHGALRIVRNGVDIAVLDDALPGLRGLEVMRQLRREGNGVPVVLLGSCSEEIDRIVGFEVGADDYVPKPCSPRELLARVRAVARRCGVRFDAMPALLRFGRLEIDEAAREARLDGRDAGLKPREFALLLTMARSPGVAFSRALLLERVWGYDFDGDERTVDVHVRRLRLRVEERPSRPGYVRTVHGYGYKFSADPERASPPRGP